MNSIEELDKLYSAYLSYYRKNNWTWEDISCYLKKNRIDYEEYKFKEFCEKIKNDEKFSSRWGQIKKITDE